VIYCAFFTLVNGNYSFTGPERNSATQIFVTQRPPSAVITKWKAIFQVDSIRLFVIGSLWPINSTAYPLREYEKDVLLTAKRGDVSLEQHPNPARLMTILCRSSQRELTSRRVAGLPPSHNSLVTTPFPKSPKSFKRPKYVSPPLKNDSKTASEYVENIISATNTLFLASAFESKLGGKVVDFLVHTASAMGIPSVLWMADQLGEFQVSHFF
jgi:hypothetical protein